MSEERKSEQEDKPEQENQAKKEKPPYEPPRSMRDPVMAEKNTEAELKALDAEQKFLRAGVEFDKGDIDEALMLLRSALALSPGNSKYHYNAGFLYWQKGLIEVAVNHYKLFVRYAAADDKDLEIIKGRITYLENEIKSRRFKR